MKQGKKTLSIYRKTMLRIALLTSFSIIIILAFTSLSSKYFGKKIL